MGKYLKVFKGTTRLCLKVFGYVVKIPNFTYCHLHFLNGCYANWSEHMYCKTFNGLQDSLESADIPSVDSSVAPSLFCSWFGLVQVQRYCEPLGRDITDEELHRLDHVRGGETKNSNFGYYNGKVVCVDYP